MIEALRTGSWLTAARLRVYPLMFLVMYVAALAWSVAGWDGKLMANGQPLGTDFSQVYVAGTFVLDGHPATPYDNQAHLARQQDYFGRNTAFYAWHYPPYFLALAALFALFPYVLALYLWQLASFPLYLAAAGRAAPGNGLCLLVAAAFPAVLINVGHGHNGFLTAGLLGLGLAFVDRRPVLAGLLFACLAYKPQYGLLLPLALAAGGYWRAFLAAAVGVAILTGATLLAFGPETWSAFFSSTAYSRTEIVEQGNTGWYKIQTIFSAARMLGASVSLAYLLQGIVTLASAAAVVFLWYRRVDWRLRAAALMTATMLATPYALDYDMMVLGPALAFLASYLLEKGFLPWEKTLLAAVWIMPLLARSIAQHTLIPFGQIMTLALFAVILRHGLAAARLRPPAGLRAVLA